MLQKKTILAAVLWAVPILASALASLPMPACSHCGLSNLQKINQKARQNRIYAKERRWYQTVSMSKQQINQAANQSLTHSSWFPNDTAATNPKNGKYVLRTNWYRERPYVSVGRRLPAPGDTLINNRSVGAPSNKSVLKNNFDIPGDDFNQQAKLPLHMSLREAILLSLRNNPEVVNSELQRIVDKFAVVAAFKFFEPQYQLNGSTTFTQGSSPSYSVDPGVSIRTPIGTVLSASYDSSFAGGGSGALFSIKQPILKGGGYAFNTINWYNALDSNDIAKLTFKNNVITTVTSVINSYRTIVQDNNNIAIQKRTLVKTKKMVARNKLKVKVGKLAPSDLLQEQANLAQQQLSLQQTLSQFYSDYQNFLKTLGLISNAKVLVSNHILLGRLKKPNLTACVQTALLHNVAYNQALIQINVDQRALIGARNQARWQLNMTATLATNDNASVIASGENPANNLQTGTTNPSVGFTLDIPIDRVQEKQAIIEAQVALDQAKVNVAEQKAALERSITNQVQQIDNQFEQVRIAELSVKLNKQNYRDVMIKLKYGKTTVFEANTYRDDLLQSETSLINAKIALLNLITDLNQQLGTTLNKWHIKLRY